VPIFVPPFGVRQEDVASAIVTAAATRTDKPVLAVLMGREGLPEGRAALLDAGIPTFVFPESVAGALAALNRQVEWMAKPSPSPARLDVDSARAATILARAQADGRERLTGIEALDLLEAYGVPVAKARLVTDDSRLAAAAADVGFPLVMKIVSPDIEHKTDVGGVRVDLRSTDDVVGARAAMARSVAAGAPRARITGVLLQRMVTGGRELIAGISRDTGFGPLVMFGLGGVLVEALGDVVFRMAPIDATQAEEMLASIRGTKLLDGLRGDLPVNRDALGLALRRVAQLGDDFAEIAELDVNPLLAFPDRVVAVDARVRIRRRA
jgi:acyl-CoA synthetase (NDP forming)